MSLLDLPNELLGNIAVFLDSDNDLIALGRTCRLFHAICTPHLYARDAARELSRALTWATEHDNVETAQRSLDAGTPSGLTTLLNQAARNDAVGVLQLLLGQDDLDLNATGGDGGRTLLLEAAVNGSSRVLGCLLAMDGVDPNLEDNDGLTALAHAAQCDQVEVVDLLIAHPDIDVNVSDPDEETPLLIAARKGHAHVVERLLSVDSINPNFMIEVDIGVYNTALTTAAYRLYGVWDSGPQEDEPRYLRAVELLLAHPATVVDFQQSAIMSTMYWWSAQDGYDRLFTLLVAKGAERNPMAANGLDLFSLVAQCGHAGVLKVMLEDNHIQPDLHGKNGRTPLSYAAEQSHLEVIQLLLETGQVDVNSGDEDGHTPLWWTFMHAWERADDAATLLLRHNAIIPEIDDKDELAAVLDDAVERDSSVISKILLDQARGKGFITPAEERNLLSVAVTSGNEQFVRLLLQTGNIDLNSLDKGGHSVLGLVVSYDRFEMVDLFLSQPAIDPNILDYHEKAVLLLAVTRLHSALVHPGKGKEGDQRMIDCQISFIQRLLEHPAVTTESLPYNTLTWLLFESLSSAQHKILELLIEKDVRLDRNAKVNDKKPKTILAWAQEKGHPALAQLLVNKESQGSEADE